MFISLIFLFPVISQAQGYINKSKKTVKKGLLEYIEKNQRVELVLSETDSTLSITIAGTTSLAAEFNYRFDEKGKCSSEKTIANCDSCFQHYLKDALNKNQYGWIKINENQYVSDYKFRLLLELPGKENVYSFMILRTNWSREMYKMILNKN